MIMTVLRYLIIPVVFIILYLLFLRPLQKTVFANWAAAPTPRSLPLLPANLQTPMTVKQLEAQLSGASPYGNAERDLMSLPTPSKMDMIRSAWSSTRSRIRKLLPGSSELGLPMRRTDEKRR